MCKNKSEGLRCHSHAKAAFDKAEQALLANPDSEKAQKLYDTTRHALDLTPTVRTALRKSSKELTNSEPVRAIELREKVDKLDAEYAAIKADEKANRVNPVDERLNKIRVLAENIAYVEESFSWDFDRKCFYGASPISNESLDFEARQKRALSDIAHLGFDIDLGVQGIITKQDIETSKEDGVYANGSSELYVTGVERDKNTHLVIAAFNKHGISVTWGGNPRRVVTPIYYSTDADKAEVAAINTSVERLNSFSMHADSTVRAAVAEFSRDPELLSRMYEAEKDQEKFSLVGYALMANPNTPATILANNAEGIYFYRVAANPSTPALILVNASKSDSVDLRHPVATNPSLPAEVAANLIFDDDEDVRSEVWKREDFHEVASIALSKGTDGKKNQDYYDVLKASPLSFVTKIAEGQFPSHNTDEW